MSSRSETSASALERLQADVGDLAKLLATGHAALPELAMGTDSEGVVHVGVDRGGQVVRLDLDSSWRDTFPRDELGGAVSDALQQAVQVRTGDWAAAVAANHRGPSRDTRVRGPHGPADARSDVHGPMVTLAPSWSADADDDAVRDALLTALAAQPEPTREAPSARPVAVRELAEQTREELLDSAEHLPVFMRGPVQASLERVHDDVVEALALPVASEGVASRGLGAYASRLQECVWLLQRPAGLPAASDVWVSSAAGLTAGLASAHRPSRSVFSRLRRRATA